MTNIEMYNLKGVHIQMRATGVQGLSIGSIKKSLPRSISLGGICSLWMKGGGGVSDPILIPLIHRGPGQQ